jgi:Tannase and feruloyl esterase
MARHAWSRTATRVTALFIGLLCCAPTLAAVASCSDLTAPTVPGAEVLSITGVEAYNVTSPILPPFLYDYVGNLNVCNVSVYLTHPGVDDRVLVQLFLPLTNWSGRFQATGGGGWSTSFGEFLLARGAKGQYATARTDGGLGQDFYDPSSWALRADGTANVPLLTSYASRGSHDMAVVGKAVTESFYGEKITYSYFTGCSTGGRQGLAEAQLYPDEFDGILAASPTLNWPSLMTAGEWPQVVMNQEGYFPTRCEFRLFLNAMLRQCDALDGVVDGVIANVQGCEFNPSELVGSEVVCDDVNVSSLLPSSMLIKL